MESPLLRLRQMKCCKLDGRTTQEAYPDDLKPLQTQNFKEVQEHNRMKVKESGRMGEQREYEHLIFASAVGAIHKPVLPYLPHGPR